MIEVINLQKSFGDNKVLDGIDMNIEKGEIVVVIGPSGSGKSTFLRCLNCMDGSYRRPDYFQWCGYCGSKSRYQCAPPPHGYGVPAF